MLHEQSDTDKADQELPDQVDAHQHADLLQELGLKPRS